MAYFPKDYRRVEKIINGDIDFDPDYEPQRSIKDFYEAQKKGTTASATLAYEHGLSNFSNIEFGDERLHFDTSFSTDAFFVEQINQGVEDHGLTISDKDRALKYAEANRRVSKKAVDQMEATIREKLNQRTTSGPFQLRRTFKYFDRDGSGDIDFSEMRYAFKIMGFSFTDMQVLALFAKYDSGGEGDISYHEFIDNLMEKDFKGVEIGGYGKARLKDMMSNLIKDDAAEGEGATGAGETAYDSDFDEEEFLEFEEVEIKKVFEMIDKDKSGYIDMEELKLLLIALGKELPDEKIGEVMTKLDKSNDGTLDFMEFRNWWFEQLNYKRSDGTPLNFNKK